MKRIFIIPVLLAAVFLMGSTFPEAPEAKESEAYIPPAVETPEPTPTPKPEARENPDGFVSSLDERAEAEGERPIPELATDYEVELIARTIWGEAGIDGGCPIVEHRAAVAWCILNRVDAWGESIEEVVTAEGQFHGYIWWGECPEEHLELAEDVVDRWEREHAGEEDVGRVLPGDYLWFRAWEGHNRFRNSYEGSYNVWDFSAESPY